MNWLSVLCLGSSVALLGGCAVGTSQAPFAVTYPRTEQQKMQAAHHWDVLAEYEAARILAAVKDKSKPIHIEPATQVDSPFAQAYQTMLQSQLVGKGAVVVTEPVSGCVRVSYLTQVLEHKDRGYVAPAPGTYTALGVGVVAVTAAADSWQPGGLAALPVLLAADLLSGGHAQVEPTEVIITTRVIEGILVLHSDTDIFYYNPGDTDHYALTKGRTFKVVDEFCHQHERCI
jgi:hypothetical protein